MRSKTVSVIIPTHEREKLLVRCLKSVLNSNYPKNRYEIIVVSDSRTHANCFIDDAISRMLDDFGLNSGAVRLLNVSKRIGAAKARNIALKVANGEIIAFIDDDVIVHKDWLKNLVKGLSLYGANVGAVGGRITKGSFNSISYKRKPIGTFSWSGHTYMNFDVVKRCKVDWVRGCNMAVRKMVLNEVGGFDEALGDFSTGEDIDLCLRIKSSHYDIVYEPTAVVLHEEAPVGGIRSSLALLAYWYMRNSAYIFLKIRGPKKILIIPRRFIAIVILCVSRAARDRIAGLNTVYNILTQAILGLIGGITLKLRMKSKGRS